MMFKQGLQNFFLVRIRSHYNVNFNFCLRQIKVERYVVTFRRPNSSATPSLQKYYYVNPAIAYQTLAKQQELAAVSDINLSFQYESLVSAETAN